MSEHPQFANESRSRYATCDVTAIEQDICIGAEGLGPGFDFGGVVADVVCGQPTVAEVEPSTVAVAEDVNGGNPVIFEEGTGYLIYGVFGGAQIDDFGVGRSR